MTSTTAYAITQQQSTPSGSTDLDALEKGNSGHKPSSQDAMLSQIRPLVGSGGEEEEEEKKIDLKAAKQNLMLRHAQKYHKEGRSCSCCRFGIPLHVTLTLVILCLVVLSAVGVFAALLIAFLVVQSELISDIRDSIQESTTSRVENMVVQIYYGVSSWRDMWHSGLISGGFVPTNETDRAQAHKAALAVYKNNFNTASVANVITSWTSTNKLLGIQIGIASDPKLVVALDCWRTNSLDSYVFADQVTGDLATPDTPFTTLIPFVPNGRPYYVEAYGRAINGDMAIKFGTTYVGGSDGKTLLSPVAGPIVDYANNKSHILGVSTISMSFDHIRTFMKQINVGKTGMLYLMERKTGVLLAANQDSVAYQILGPNGKYQTINAGDCNNTLIMDTSALILANNGYAAKLVSSNTTTANFVYFSNGEQWYVGINWILYNGLDWIIVTCVHVSDFNTGIIVGTVVAVAVSVLLVFISTIIGVISSILTSRQLVKVVNAMIFAADMQLDVVDRLLGLNKDKHKNVATSQIYEVQLIQMSFMSLITALKQYRMFLPANLLKTLDEQHKGVNADAGDEDTDDAVSNPASSFRSHARSSIRSVKKNKRKSNSILPAGMSDAISHVRRSITSLGKTNVFDIGLHQRELSVMYVRLANLDELSKLSPNDIVECYKKFAIGLEMREGLVELQSADLAIVTFTPTARARNHCLTAALAAIQMINYIKNEANPDLEKNVLPSLKVTIGISCGPTLMGNVGSDHSRKFAVFGESTFRARSLEALNQHYHSTTGILIDEYFAKKVTDKDDFICKPLDHCSIISRSKKEGSTRSLQQFAGFDVYELTERVSKHADDEWMYKLEAENRQKAYRQLFDGYDECKAGRFDSGIDKIEGGFLHMFPKDQTVLDLVFRLQQAKARLARPQEPSNLLTPITAGDEISSRSSSSNSIVFEVSKHQQPSLSEAADVIQHVGIAPMRRGNSCFSSVFKMGAHKLE